jgi:hypothetical protein
MSYQRLIEEHDEIDRLARQLERGVEVDTPDPARAFHLLVELSRAVSEHLSYEDRRVYSRLLAPKAPRAVGPEVDFEASFQALRTDWLTYLGDWNIETLACDWTAFREETRAMMTRLRSRVRDETNLIYPLALQQGAIRLREQRPAIADQAAAA